MSTPTEYLREIGARGGSRTSAAKAAAARANGAAPCAPGKRRGRPPGKKQPVSRQ